MCQVSIFRSQIEKQLGHFLAAAPTLQPFVRHIHTWPTPELKNTNNNQPVSLERVMSSKAGSSKRAGQQDITNQAKKIKGLDVRGRGELVEWLGSSSARQQLVRSGWLKERERSARVALTLLTAAREHSVSYPPHTTTDKHTQEVLKLVKKLAEQTKKETHKEKCVACGVAGLGSGRMGVEGCELLCSCSCQCNNKQLNALMFLLSRLAGGRDRASISSHPTRRPC